MPTTAEEVDSLESLTSAQLDTLARDFRQPEPVRKLAQAARLKLAKAKLKASVADFKKATPVFVELTKLLLQITEAARKNPIGDAVGMLGPAVRRAGEIFSQIAEVPVEPSFRATASAAQPADDPVADEAFQPNAAAAATPPPGTATNSKQFAEIANEYIATFDAAKIHDERATLVGRLRQQMVGFKDVYESIGQPLGIPWHFIGLVHALESSFNFGTHLHNGDSLSHRTKREPKGRPPASVADPPFAWSTSATDALQMHKLNVVQNWTLARQLFELERFNGFGYRFRGLASPYLWSFSDRYVRGKFVQDGVFDPNAVSKQAGAGVLLKALIAAGNIQRPPS
jgi:lysozyme family protein